jgi:AraC-like DNA-binding protein
MRKLLAARGHALSEASLRRRLASESASFTSLVIDARMTIALERLQSSSHSITRIALDVGYESASRFAVRFRARFGIAPSEIRGGDQ